MLFVALIVLVATVPRYDGPRAVSLESPWPQIGKAFVVDPAANIVATVAIVAAAILAVIGRSAPRQLARAVKYGPAFLGQSLQGKGDPEKRFHREMHRLAQHKRAERFKSLIAPLLLLGLTIWALVQFLSAVPTAAPALVWLACARDVLILASLAAILFCTAETKHERFEKLIKQHQQRHAPAQGTAEAAGASER